MEDRPNENPKITFNPTRPIVDVRTRVITLKCKTVDKVNNKHTFPAIGIDNIIGF